MIAAGPQCLALMITVCATVGVAEYQPFATPRGTLMTEEPVAFIQTQAQVDFAHWQVVGQEFAHLLQEAATAQPENDLSGEELSFIAKAPSVPTSARHSADKVMGMDTDFWLILIIAVESSVLLFTIGIPFVIWLIAYVLGRIIKGAIETFDRLVIGTDVTIKDLRTNVFQGVVMIEGLEVHNPGENKWNSKYLLKAGVVCIDLDMAALFCSFFRHFVIEKIEFRNVDVIVEKGKNGSNVQDVISFLAGDKENTKAEVKGADKSAKAEVKDAANSEKSRTQVTLHEVNIEDVGARAEVQMLGGRGMRVSVGDICYKDFSEEVGESTVGPIIQILLKSVLKTVTVNVVGKNIGERLF